ncbi:hypothetical protein DPMN_140917 [Dreissena polymorpha]|uniref:Uncharacterized protein n=1 Tax=Dreissena polymorpha TaxID=45954 RepID=A0A9D4G8M3_DREPO|nr:hypothetical protein DPMN_140917 [Dreissena polymorpha]
MVFNSSASHIGPILYSPNELSASSSTNRQKTSNQESAISSFHLIGQSLRDRGISEITTDIILQSWRKSTCQQYGSYLKRWLCFSNEEQIDPFYPPTHIVLKG